MNSSIQCLANIEELSNYLLKKYNTFNINNQQLACSFTNLLYKLKNSKEKYISPKLFKDVVGQLNPLFAGNQASDAKDLVFFIIERLHQELKHPVTNLNKQPINFMQLEIISQDENMALQNFINDFIQKNKSIICDTFYGIIKTVMLCDGCKIKKYSYQTFNMINFVLKKVKEDKILQMGQYYKGIELIDAFESDRKEEKLEGENMIYCNRCKGMKTGTHKQEIYSLPSVLIIVLNRGKNNQDFNEEFNFPEAINFNIYTDLIINKASYKRFYLSGVITHLGESSSSGHFICYWRNSVNDKYICYNDASVTETVVSIEDAMSAKISDNIYEKKTPYILFYHQF